MNSIGYLVSEYPARSHTFISREIAALRRKGLSVLPFSIREALESASMDEVVPAVLQRGSLKYVGYASMMLLAHPIRALSTWWLALKHRPPGLRGFVWSQFHFVEAVILAAMLQKKKVNHLHSHFANSGATIGMLAAHLICIPWSLTLHGISETDYPAGLLLRDKLTRARFVACASWFMRAQAMRLTPMDVWPKLHVVRCAIDAASLPLALSSPKNAVFELVCVGRMSPEKGHLGLIEALARLVENHVDVRLTIVGDGPLRTEIEFALAQKGLIEHVRLLGALPERETLIEIACGDALVLSSLMEGLPVVLMEAMALGKPVVAPYIAGIPELVEHEVTGLLFRPGDWKQLADRTMQLAANPKVSMEMGQRGQTRVCTEFDADIAVAPLLRLFRPVSRE
ncbi:glycosyltransferase family 4 protein [Parafrankia sp. BMG5.11]|uniref:glycosyltransferase family 4 protein n=1 Tax=Parafrankia sp. BMG5.11 TaxID=222540 RepID=UPI00103D81AB|nr:glycosyltransferase family 4 protein [Parafrankia sp. BMG5.11]TCJ32811.1 colanic acid biosynthesis glycosyltransferase WcaL [Parafrankia sp. BMG5.11]